MLCNLGVCTKWLDAANRAGGSVICRDQKQKDYLGTFPGLSGVSDYALHNKPITNRVLEHSAGLLVLSLILGVDLIV